MSSHKRDAGRILLRCLSYLGPYWRLTAGAYLALLGGNALALAIPQFIRWIVDRGIGGQDVRLLGLSVLGLLGLTLLKGGLTFVQGQWTEVASQSVAYDLRNAIHRKLSDLSFSYHDRTETGQILSRAVQDVDRVRFVTGRAFLRLIDATILLLGTAAMMAQMNLPLALLALAAMPLLSYRAFQLGRVLRPLSLEIQQQLAVLTTRLEQNLRGARVVKAFAQEENEIARFDRENARWFDLSARSARLSAVNVPLLELIASASVVLIIWYGGLLVTQGRLTLGELVAFSTYLAQLVQPVRRLGMIIPALSIAAAAGERVFEILDAVSEVQETADAAPLPPVRGHVRFEHVSFAYFGRHRVLTDVTFEAVPGQVIALLGATGSGKSTIINLIPRFYDPTAGRITIDGYDIHRVTLNSLRDQIANVLQETTLFAASVRENIAFGRPDASEEEIIAAARAAQAHSFICEMPNGYDTRVGERGLTLSGGQRQRIAIARALLKDPRILILDDATSSVDTETEQLIQTALQRLMRGRTSFVIAQRLSTLRKADLIIILENGRIAARGTHAELLRTSGLYAEIYHYQLRPQGQTP
ncbi:MAG: ABC transporter ATP-binding protein [Anaerolineae bacterium CG2_30_64_16]|nr:MAG: ABC transporter ATP-binding protein [Anaerolineae bacterium CG2_30_64_16]